MPPDRVCAKCQSMELVSVRRGHDLLFISFFRSVDMKTLVCADCGHIEEFVPERQLEKLRRHGRPATI